MQNEPAVADEELERLEKEVIALRPGQGPTRKRLLNQFETIVRLRLKNDAGRFIKQAQSLQFDVFSFGPDDPNEVAMQHEEGRSAFVELIRSVQYHLDAMERSKDDHGASVRVSLDSATVERLAKIVCGGEGGPDPHYPKYRSSWYLTRFFKDAGLPQYVHDGSTRKQWVTNTLDDLSSADLFAVIVRLALRKEYDSEEQWQKAVEIVNEALEPEGLKVNGDPRSPSVVAIGSAPVSSQGSGRQAHEVNKRVFVVHGRDSDKRNAMFDFLRALALEPIEWEHAVGSTGSGAPYTGSVVEKSIREAAAVLVLLTPEEEAHLLPRFIEDHDPDYERNPTPQARLNVIFEAGMAFGVVPERTIVVEFGTTRPFSDIAGRNTVRFDVRASHDARNKLATRLELLGLPVDKRGGDWLRAGEFNPK
jgi:predicted nucleotide-binding protein